MVNKKNILICLFAFKALFFVLPDAGFCADETFSEILEVDSENDSLLIKVAKKYPIILFRKNSTLDEALIEFPNAKFHQDYKTDEFSRLALLQGVAFAKDISITNSKLDGPGIVISIKLKDEKKLIPKLESTRDNVVKIVFVEEIDKEALLSKSVIELFNKAVNEQQKGNPGEAEKIYKEILLKKANFYPAKYNLIQIYAADGFYEKALESNIDLINEYAKENEISDLDKNLFLYKSSLALLCLLNKNYTKSKKYFTELIDVSPTYFDGYFYLGLIDEKGKNIEDAIDNFNKAIALKEDFYEAIYHKSVLLLLVKNKKEAIDGFVRVLEIAPDTKYGKLATNELEKLDKKKLRSHK